MGTIDFLMIEVFIKKFMICLLLVITASTSFERVTAKTELINTKNASVVDQKGYALLEQDPTNPAPAFKWRTKHNCGPKPCWDKEGVRHLPGF